ncbi:hypothetical protein [Streptomyces shaanxiensis]|uniref:TetR family transcriptional regulator n=1 Tax=Streptomyces shaanxiensis TaxID=653357 RepID=A0ABP7UE52_9ACTN
MSVPETAIGQWFVDALNEGLNRSVVHTLPRRAQNDDVLADPFAAAVLRRFEDCLPTVLGPRERDDRALRTALVRRARDLLTRALAPVPESAGRPPFPPRPTLPDRQEAVVSTVLLECAVTLLMEPGNSLAPPRERVALVRALGRSLRESPIPDSA